MSPRAQVKTKRWCTHIIFDKYILIVILVKNMQAPIQISFMFVNNSTHIMLL